MDTGHRCRVTAISPAPFSAAFDLAGARRFARRAMTAQLRRGQSMALTADGRTIALAMLWPWTPTRTELALAISPEAAPHMRELVKIARVTLQGLTDAGIVVFSRVEPGADKGRRMARLIGMRPLGARVWCIRGRKPR